jgi:hypothetical protein
MWHGATSLGLGILEVISDEGNIQKLVARNHQAKDDTEDRFYKSRR